MDTHEQWEQFLSPQTLHERLISASLFITTFELLKESVVGRIRDFYIIGFDENGPTVGGDYKTRVLSRHRSPVYASLSWLLESEAIDDADLEAFERIKSARNNLAHELPSLVFNGEDFKHVEIFHELVALLRKIEVWWVVNVEIPTNPDYDGQEIDEDGIVPGPILTLQMMFQVLSGNEELLNTYRNTRK